MANTPTTEKEKVTFKMPATYAGLVKIACEFKFTVVQCFSIFCSDNQTKRYRRLMKQTTDKKFFECEGQLFKGDRELMIIRFMMDNPQPEDFYVWCQKNCERFTQS